jgi:hypothetical protein
LLIIPKYRGHHFEKDTEEEQVVWGVKLTFGRDGISLQALPGRIEGIKR